MSPNPDSVIGTDALLEGLAHHMPIATAPFDPGAQKTGLVIVDEVNGFATVGCGPLAPPAPNPQVSRMVEETDRLARRFADQGWPIAAFLDTHEPGKPEPPYPPHCEIGTGQEELVPELAWLADAPTARLIKKDCINGFVGAIDPETGANQIVDWTRAGEIEAALVVGICTDICVMDFVLTFLSARNHGLMPTLTDIVVYEPGCATYDLPRAVTAGLDLPETASHPQALTHHLGLYFMASRGAALTAEIVA